MKTKLSLVLAVATALGSTSSLAQDEQRPPDPGANPPADGQRPPTPVTPPGDRGNGARPDGDRRGPGGGDARREGPPREPERSPRDGDAPGGGRGPRENERGPRDGERAPRDGERGPREERHREHFGDGEAAMPRPQKPTAYLGVATVPVPAALGAQLNLPEGFGLLVEQIVPESPAAKGGVQRFDVLKMLNDQQLVDPDQLATLVRSAGKDTDISLTVLRKGAEEKLTVKVGERLLPDRPVPSRLGDFNLHLEPLRQLPAVAHEVAHRAEEQAHRMQEQLRVFQQRMGDFQKRVMEWQKNPTGTPPEAPKLEMPKPPEPPPAPESPQPTDLLRESRPGGAPQVRFDQDGNSTTWSTAQARILMKDDQGEIDLRSENGQRLATVRNPQGDVIFEGPVDTAEQRGKLPEEIRRKIEFKGLAALAPADPADRNAPASGRDGAPGRPDGRRPASEPDIQ